MKYRLSIVLIMLLVACQTKKEVCVLQAICEEGMMTDSWYFFLFITVISDTMEFEEKFLILVDTLRQPKKDPSLTNFPFFMEDTIPTLNNKREILVSLVNNTKDTMQIMMQAWSIICIKEAKNSCHEWKSIEYFERSPDEVFYYKKINPQSINSFLTNRFMGNKRVEMRFKLLAKERFYYSNSFWGTIEACAFQLDTTDNRLKYRLEESLIL
ncbi:MAG: hypothetical protein AB8G15_17135 [Saprospiraceae bacterium]